MNEPNLRISILKTMLRAEQIAKGYVTYVNLKHNKSMYWVQTNAVKLSKPRWDKYTPISKQWFPLSRKKEEEWNRLVGVENRVKTKRLQM